MARFSCSGCNGRHSAATGCPRCHSGSEAQMQRCALHGARHLPGCRTCRSLTRSIGL
ncbi:hypothetical protein [Streptosporangium sandarakinum]